MESFPSKGFLGCPLDRLALWRLIRHDRGGSMSFHQFLQWRCGRSYFWNWAWWLIIYRTLLPIQAWRIEFSVLKGSVRTVGKRVHRIIFWKRNGKLPLCQKQIPHLELYTKGGPIHRKDGSAILATRSQREWKRGWLWSSCACKGKEDLIPIKRLWRLPSPHWYLLLASVCFWRIIEGGVDQNQIGGLQRMDCRTHKLEGCLEGRSL